MVVWIAEVSIPVRGLLSVDEEEDLLDQGKWFPSPLGAYCPSTQDSDSRTGLVVSGFHPR